MRLSSTKRFALLVPSVALAAVVPLVASSAFSSPGQAVWSSVPANPKTTGVVAPDVLSPGLVQVAVAQGSMKLENGAAAVPYYGYDDRHYMPTLGVPLPVRSHETRRTRPSRTRTPTSVLGTACLAPTRPTTTARTSSSRDTSRLPARRGYLTRVNLDADAAHRVTLMADEGRQRRRPLPTIDGSTWDPFAQRLLLTSEGNATTGGLWQSDARGRRLRCEDISGIARPGRLRGRSRTTPRQPLPRRGRGRLRTAP